MGSICWGKNGSLYRLIGHTSVWHNTKLQAQQRDMLYTGHNDYNRQGEPATFVAVGEQDGIASPKCDEIPS